MTLALPVLYPIVDAEHVAEPIAFAEALLGGGAGIVQLRAKSWSARDAYEAGLELRRLTREHGALFAVNDRADLAAAVEADVLHLGQDDMSAADARKLFEGIVGLSTHDPDQVARAQTLPIDYIAFGPIFSTASKANPDPVTGLDALRAAAAASRLPVVAIGGIRRDNCNAVLTAGARSLAVIADLGRTPAEANERMIQWTQELQR